MIKLTRDAFTMAAEVFNFFHNAVKKTAKLKVSFTDPALTNENPGQNGKKTTIAPTTKSKAKVKADSSTSELGDISTKSPTTSSKTAKKKTKVQERKLPEANSESSKSDKEDATSDLSEKKTKQVNEPPTAQEDITSQMGAMSICGPEGTPKTAKKKKGKK